MKRWSRKLEGKLFVHRRGQTTYDKACRFAQSNIFASARTSPRPSLTSEEARNAARGRNSRQHRERFVFHRRFDPRRSSVAGRWYPRNIGSWCLGRNTLRNYWRRIARFSATLATRPIGGKKVYLPFRQSVRFGRVCFDYL